MEKHYKQFNIKSKQQPLDSRMHLLQPYIKSASNIRTKTNILCSKLFRRLVLVQMVDEFVFAI